MILYTNLIWLNLSPSAPVWAVTPLLTLRNQRQSKIGWKYSVSFSILAIKSCHPPSELPVLMTCAETLKKSCCLVCITCGGALDVSDFRLTGDSLCGHHACSLRRWGCSGEAAPAPVNYQLINSGSFLLVLVSACKRLLVCGIGGRHCDYGIRKKKSTGIFFSQGLIRCTRSLSASHLLR